MCAETANNRQANHRVLVVRPGPNFKPCIVQTIATDQETCK